MARAAADQGRLDVADAVFAAANQPGYGRDWLRRRRRELLGGRPFQGPLLSVVSD
jgi:hypothetical protein